MKPEPSRDRASELAASLRGRLVRAHERFGAARVAQAAGVTEHTVFRALGGGKLYFSSWRALEVGLNELESLR